MGMDLGALMARFDLPGQCVAAVRFGNGHLQDTRLVTMRTAAGDRQVVLQGINARVFADAAKLMENMVRTTEHLRMAMAAGPPPAGRREVLTLIPARNGRAWVDDDTGGCWRATWRIRNASSHDKPTGPHQVLAVSRAFGEFLRLLADLKPESLHEVLPRFHDLPGRLSDLEAAVSVDVTKRAKAIRDEIAFVRARAHMVSCLPTVREPAGLPVRATHNDTKMNNVLLDDETGEGVCVLDLDTMMPGLSLYDFGDMVRTIANPAAEDETDLSKVELDMGLFEAAASGWLAEAGPVLTGREVRMLPEACPAMTLMIGVRFLTDYILGDTYFHTQRPGQNLDRARVQFALVESMEREAGAMQDVVR